ncbi:hypothetical protein KR044_003085 [Drosophila immigrans]|nr:hypothetical protein KR044_003085 [Drosophila immigrans]
MEARRLDRQRRASAKCSAAPTLPSSQDEEFHLRMIELYGQQACLWNTTLCEYHDAELKRKAWDDIARKLGAHLTASFVRSRIQGMRYRLNVYKLQLLEYNMSPASARQPEKLFFMDKFGFLDEIISSDEEQQLEQSESEQSDLKSSLSIASICEQRVQQQKLKLPHLVQRLRNSQRGNHSTELDVPSVVKKRLPSAKPEAVVQPIATGKHIDSTLRRRMQRLSLIEQGNELANDSSALPGSFLNIPSVVRKRLQQQLINEAPLQLDPEPETEQETEKTSPKGDGNVSAMPSQLSIPQAANSMRALPGDSISKTRVSKHAKASKTIEQLELQQQSDDEDLYRLHWAVRQEQRSRRAIALPPNHELHPSQAMPPLLFGTSLPGSSLKPSMHDTK